MDNNNIIKLSRLSKIHFSLEELEEMNRDMDSIMRLMDSIKEAQMPPECEPRPGSNIYRLRPDRTTTTQDTPTAGQYIEIPRIVE